MNHEEIATKWADKIHTECTCKAPNVGYCFWCCLKIGLLRDLCTQNHVEFVVEQAESGTPNLTVGAARKTNLKTLIEKAIDKLSRENIDTWPFLGVDEMRQLTDTILGVIVGHFDGVQTRCHELNQMIAKLCPRCAGDQQVFANVTDNYWFHEEERPGQMMRERVCPAGFMHDRLIELTDGGPPPESTDDQS